MVSTKNRLKDNLIGDKAFYKKVMLIIIPIIIQTTITSVVNLIDNKNGLKLGLCMENKIQ